MAGAGDECFARVGANEAVPADGLGRCSRFEEERELGAGEIVITCSDMRIFATDLLRSDFEVNARRSQELGRDGGAERDEIGRVGQAFPSFYYFTDFF